MDAQAVRMRLREAVRPPQSAPTTTALEISSPSNSPAVEAAARFLEQFGLSQKQQEVLRSLLRALPSVQIAPEVGAELQNVFKDQLISEAEFTEPAALARRLAAGTQWATTAGKPAAAVEVKATERLATLLGAIAGVAPEISLSTLVQAHLGFDAETTERLRAAGKAVGDESPVQTLLRVVTLLEQRLEGASESDRDFQKLLRELRQGLGRLLALTAEQMVFEEFLTLFQDSVQEKLPAERRILLSPRNQQLLTVLEQQITTTLQSFESRPEYSALGATFKTRLLPLLTELTQGPSARELPPQLRGEFETLMKLLAAPGTADELPRALHSALERVREVLQQHSTEAEQLVWERDHPSRLFDRALLQTIRQALRAVVAPEPQLRGGGNGAAGVVNPEEQGGISFRSPDSLPRAPESRTPQSQGATSARPEEPLRRTAEYRRLSELVERYTVPESGDFMRSEGARFLEQTLVAQQALSQAAPLMKAAGEPALLLFPGLFQGLLTTLSITEYGAPTARQTAEGDSPSSSSTEYRRLTVQLELPHMGLLTVQLAFRNSELLIAMQSERAEVAAFLRSRVGALTAAARRIGFSSVDISASRKVPHPIRAPWVEDVVRDGLQGQG